MDVRSQDSPSSYTALFRQLPTLHFLLSIPPLRAFGRHVDLAIIGMVSASYTGRINLRLDSGKQALQF